VSLKQGASRAKKAVKSLWSKACCPVSSSTNYCTARKYPRGLARIQSIASGISRHLHVSRINSPSLSITDCAPPNYCVLCGGNKKILRSDSCMCIALNMEYSSVQASSGLIPELRALRHRIENQNLPHLFTNEAVLSQNPQHDIVSSAAWEQQRQFVSDVCYELRTP